MAQQTVTVVYSFPSKAEFDDFIAHLTAHGYVSPTTTPLGWDTVETNTNDRTVMLTRSGVVKAGEWN